MPINIAFIIIANDNNPEFILAICIYINKENIIFKIY